MIVEFSDKYAEQIWSIYKYYVEHTNATLDLKVPPKEKYLSFCQSVSKQFLFLVYIENDEVLGFAYVNKWKEKAGYNFTLESTIYVNKDCVNKGIGSKLYGLLILRVRKLNYTNLVACLTLPNTKSVALHERMGFIKAGHFNAIAQKNGETVDVGYWQLVL